MLNRYAHECYRQTGNSFETVIAGNSTGIACITPYDTLEEARAAYYHAMHQRTGDWRLKGIKQTGPNEFKAYIKGPKDKSYLVGTFTNEKEAERAIFEAMTARWNG